MVNPDRHLVLRMLSGEEGAFNEFFDAHFPRLYRFALARMDRDADAAEDVVQATLCAAISKLGSYRGEAPVFTWLCTFCRHEIASHFARRRKQPPSIDLAEDNVEVAAALESLWVLTGEGPEHALRRQEIERFVHVTLDHLPRHYADALEWKYTEGIPVREIALRLGLSPKAAESLLTRAREAFRDGFSTLAGSS